MIRVLQNNVALMRGFSSPVFEGHLLLFRAIAPRDTTGPRGMTDPPGTNPPSVGAWRCHVRGQVEIHDIACHHKGMIEERALAEIATIIFDQLSELYPDRGVSASGGLETMSRLVTTH